MSASLKMSLTMFYVKICTCFFFFRNMLSFICSFIRSKMFLVATKKINTKTKKKRKKNTKYSKKFITDFRLRCQLAACHLFDYVFSYLLFRLFVLPRSRNRLLLIKSAPIIDQFEFVVQQANRKKIYRLKKLRIFLLKCLTIRK